MQRKLQLIALFLCFGVINFAYPHEEKTEGASPTKVSEQMAFVLLRLVDGEIRMEKYSAQELNAAITNINKEESDAHLVMTLDLKENDKMPHSMQWDPETDGKINITSEDAIYTMPLESLFKDTQEEIIAVCFDCEINYKQKMSYIEIILPIKIEEMKIAFLFNDKTTAACGFFMGNKDFEDLLSISGKLTKKDALESGLICPFCKKTVSNEKTSFFSRIKNSVTSAKNFITAKILAIKNAIFKKKKEATKKTNTKDITSKSIVKNDNEKEEKVSFLSRIKNSAIYAKNLLIAKILAIKNAVFKKKVNI